ncbi:alpha/beta fold hydrolase [Amycolatopsis thermophila]|uniref:Pimeloyl-ACP methyl ester carboxylesterase n=1 Tax=Amycolatopsis thermophila TaxID=206084 RepID=A0ABU0F5T9_9PSEU|nr:alpha/beta fold hydrolase [Amycolatopsis thermophila]MDQ0382887.1 pimeloyl-ACP methyl ester carboxylesterase [Amycolatopsis thermophila]
MPQRADAAVRLADQGYFWLGVNYEQRDGQTVVDGSQLYVEYQIPEEQTQPHPVVLIHGGGGQGLDWLGTPDGRPGWRTLLVQRGFAVYVVDRPGHGRSPVRWNGATSGLAPSVESLGRLFSGAGNPAHTQWPDEDDVLAQLLASQVAVPGDLAADHAVMRRRGGELLDRIGPSIVMTSSAGGPSGWLMADERPRLVRALVALEPLGPSGPIPLPWGLTASPITYEPPASGPHDLGLTDVVGEAGEPTVRLQSDPPRKLPNLADLPIAIVSGEQSFAGPMDAGTFAFLQQAGCRRAEHLRLGEMGIHGNGHLMMLERNNEEVLDAVLTWLGKRLS